MTDVESPVGVFLYIRSARLPLLDKGASELEA
jgi:hypothetical protein